MFTSIFKLLHATTVQLAQNDVPVSAASVCIRLEAGMVEPVTPNNKEQNADDIHINAK
jgi:hypothetical protein